MDALKITVGALLHDVGKLLFRGEEDGRAHSQSGAEYLAKLTDDRDLLQCVKFHHKRDLAAAVDLPPDSPAYIVYIADNIAAAADRREAEGGGYGYEKSLALDSVFNILNNGTRSLKHPLTGLDDAVNFPMQTAAASPAQYKEIVRGFGEGLRGIKFDGDYINSLLELSQAWLSFVPSSTDNAQLADISLFDHAKVTAAVAACIAEYLTEQHCTDYRRELYDGEAAFDKEQAFLLLSCDVSGIQKFTYTIASKDAAKMLRSRSFYLEILMESFADDVLAQLGLSRANLLYSGGGHCYMLLPNTARARQTAEEAVKGLNTALVAHFKTLLYMAWGIVPCTAADLKGKADAQGSSLSRVFYEVSRAVSAKKLTRYSAEDILALNAAPAKLSGRECVSCGAVDAYTDEQDHCRVCRELIDISPDLMREDICFVLTEAPPEGVNAVRLPGAFNTTRYLCVATAADAAELLARDNPPLRVYGKNKLHTGLRYAAKLWMGTYAAREKGRVKTFEELAKSAQGIDRLAVLRADVDNLGTAFVSGFVREGDDPGRYETVSRKAALSGQLSLFFKKHLNAVLARTADMEYFSLGGKPAVSGTGKNALIIYSGGDDVFLVGAWNEVIEAAVDMRNAFARFCGGALTFSAGIGVYEHAYPISRMAEETGALLDTAKAADEVKDAVALFGAELGPDGKTAAGHVYRWEVFIDDVAGHKLRALQAYFDAPGVSEDRRAKGNSFLYRIKDYAVAVGSDKINLARCAYLLGRMAPTNAPEEEERRYEEFSAQIMRWLVVPADRAKLLTAITLYVYLNRDKNKEEA